MSNKRCAGFNVVGLGGEDGDQRVEDFVDVMAQEEDRPEEGEEKRGTRTAVGRAGRSARKRH